MMNSNLTTDFRNPALVRKAGMSALKKELGTVGAMYFMRQFSTGKGNYTLERYEILKDVSLKEIIGNVRKIDAEQV